MVQVTGFAGSGVVSVGKYVKYSACGYSRPQAGSGFVVVVVGYFAESGTMFYNKLDWTAHDVNGAQIEPSFARCDEQELVAGTLSADRNVIGMVTFEIPKAWKHVWVDYGPGLGDAVVTWKVY